MDNCIIDNIIDNIIEDSIQNPRIAKPSCIEIVWIWTHNYCEQLATI